jgi:hypothetical protein
MMITNALQHIVTDGALLSLVLGVLVMGSLMYNPRLWLQDYPKAVQVKVPPMSKQEKRQQRLMMVPFLLLMFGAPYLSVTLVKAANGGALTFPIAYLTVWGMLQFFNLFDAVVLDYLILTLMKPKFAVIPGSTVEDYLDGGLALQLRNYLKGIVICTILALPIAFIGSL